MPFRVHHYSQRSQLPGLQICVAHEAYRPAYVAKEWRGKQVHKVIENMYDVKRKKEKSVDVLNGTMWKRKY